MWLEITQVEELGITRRSIERKIANKEWKAQESGKRGRNGKPIREVALTSLPEYLQLRWAQRQAKSKEDVLGAAEPITTDPLEAVANALARYPRELREAFIREANRLNDIMNRFDQIDPKRVRGEAGKLVFAPAVVALCREAVCKDSVILVREPKRGKELSPFTLDGWSRRRQTEGLAIFLRQPPKPSGKADKRRSRISPDAFIWMNEHWRNFPTISHFYKRLNELAKKRKWTIPSESTVRRMYDNIPAVVRAAVFGTNKDYTSKFKPYVPRTVEDLEALQILCGDHHVLDVHAWIESSKQLVRLWLTAWQDLRTGLIWGYHLDTTPSSHTIACAYANGVRRFGAQPFSRPQDGYASYLYTDNGKDYKSRNLNGEIEVHKQAARIDGGLELLLIQQGVGIANDADLKHLLARYFNGREKPIERTFRDLADAIQNTFFRTGWCGRSTSDRPDTWRDLYQRHVKAIKKGSPSPFPLHTEIRQFMADWIDEYNASVHTRSTLNNSKIVPLTEFSQLYTTSYKIADETLALMLMKPTTGTLNKNGVQVQCLGATYVHEALSLYKGQKGADGKALQIEVRYTDEDYSQAWLILPNGAICEAARLNRSSVLQPNKESQKAVATLIKQEQKLINDFHLLTQSRLRGETVEERVASLIEVEQPAIIELPIAVNEMAQPQASVQRINRLDGKRLRASTALHQVTPTEIASTEADISIFDVPDRSRVKEFDFDEEL